MRSFTSNELSAQEPNDGKAVLQLIILSGFPLEVKQSKIYVCRSPNVIFTRREIYLSYALTECHAIKLRKDMWEESEACGKIIISALLTPFRKKVRNSRKFNAVKVIYS